MSTQRVPVMWIAPGIRGENVEQGGKTLFMKLYLLHGELAPVCFVYDCSN